jgi:hypothetical protein
MIDCAPAGATLAGPSRLMPEENVWTGHSKWAVAAIVMIVLISIGPTFVGYLIQPSGMHFTGAPSYTEDAAVHEAWAAEMARHGRYHNLQTPEDTAKGWFFSPLEFLLGTAQRVTGLPYAVVGDLLYLGFAPVLACGLMTLARRAGLPKPGFASILALLAGSFAPLAYFATKIRLIPGNAGTVVSVGGDATPIFAGPSPYLALLILILIAIPPRPFADPVRGFRLAGLAGFALAAIYPFFIPTVWLAAALCALVWARQYGWRVMAEAFTWFAALSGIPIVYWIVLPHIDREYAYFAATNWRPLFSPHVVLVSLGVGIGAVLGIPKLIRSNSYQQMLACFTLAYILALYIPAHPWRSHIFYMSPVLVIGAIAAWWPALNRLSSLRRLILITVVLSMAMLSGPFYYSRNLRGLTDFRTPIYLTSADSAAIRWIANQPGDAVVLARSDLSPWIAARAHHRVIVGHYLLTHNYHQRRAAVDAVYEAGADPRALLQAENVAWVLIDGARGVPAWARGVSPDAQFDQTTIVHASRLIAHLNAST